MGDGRRATGDGRRVGGAAACVAVSDGCTKMASWGCNAKLAEGGGRGWGLAAHGEVDATRCQREKQQHTAKRARDWTTAALQEETTELLLRDAGVVLCPRPSPSEAWHAHGRRQLAVRVSQRAPASAPQWTRAPEDTQDTQDTQAPFTP